MPKLAVVLLSILSLSSCAGLKENWNPKTDEQKKQQASIDSDNQSTVALQRVSFIQFSAPARSVDTDHVQIMTTKPSQKFVEIGTLSLSAMESHKLGRTGLGTAIKGTGESFDELTSILKTKAASLGADAIMSYEATDVPVGSDDDGVIAVGHKQAYSSGASYLMYQRKVSGVAIRFTE